MILDDETQQSNLQALVDSIEQPVNLSNFEGAGTNISNPVIATTVGRSRVEETEIQQTSDGISFANTSGTSDIAIDLSDASLSDVFTLNPTIAALGGQVTDYEISDDSISVTVRIDPALLALIEAARAHHEEIYGPISDPWN